MSRRRWLILAATILLAATALRTAWLRADPPNTSVGIVWHDEGAWVHNARNRALWGAWRTDNWNPVFIAPVFTALEYGAFEAFGVGTWQARTVPVASGLLALIALMAGLHAATSRHAERTALIGGALLAVNFTWVMWNRAALMESTMTMFIVVAWAAYAHGRHAGRCGESSPASPRCWRSSPRPPRRSSSRRSCSMPLWTIAAAARSRPCARACRSTRRRPRRARRMADAGRRRGGRGGDLRRFRLPHWQEYQFYNWQMTVTRKPSYDLRSFIDRASWLPVVQDVFTRMWLVLLRRVAGHGRHRRGAGARARPAERLLVLWVLVGLAELVVHDSGNERRYVMFVPALVALAALFAGQGLRWLPDVARRHPMRSRLLALPLLLLLLYLVVRQPRCGRHSRTRSRPAS